MKIIKPILRLFITFMCGAIAVSALSGCTQTTTNPETFTVSFEPNGGTPVASVEVENGRKIGSGAPVTTKDDGSEFVGWFKDDGTFADPWDFAIDIVTADVVLYAKWIKSQSFPTEIKLTDAPFSNTLTWLQSGIGTGTDFVLTFFAGTLSTRQETQLDQDGAYVTVTVEYYEYAATGVEYDGTHTVDGTGVAWTPDGEIPGGVYRITILADGENEATVDDVFFKGSGTALNPYLLFESADLSAISHGTVVGAGQFYRVAHDFSHEVSYAEIVGGRFDGTLDGAGYTVSVSGNAGMFYELGPDATIDDLNVTGTITSATIATLGAFAVINHGTISNCRSRAALTSTAGVVGDPSAMLLGGAGGLVGINAEDGLIIASTFIGDSSTNGVIKALIGGGGIASINYGTIERCTNRGTLGAYNSVESGKSMSNYSYMGGIAGFNYGLILESATTSTGKLLAQRYFENGTPTDTSNNRVIGGIAGYNAAGAEIRTSYFNGIRVHGDQYVGGIAGINAGLISSCYTGGRYYGTPQVRTYVGGRLDVGGIAGALEGTGAIEHCYNAANVYAYDGTPYAIAVRATGSASITVNHDGRSTGTQEYGNTPTDTLVAPEGTGNQMVSNAPMVKGDGVSYKMPASLQVLLGDEFVVVAEETVLAWQQE